MKILHLSNFKTSGNNWGEYLNDMVLHGGRSLFGENYVESVRAEHMYKNYQDYDLGESPWPFPLNSNAKSGIYGRGFSLSKTLEEVNIDRENLEEKIIGKYFDYIIISGGLQSPLLRSIQANYPKNRVAILDYHDDSKHYYYEIKELGTYFKREKSDSDPSVIPINYSIPKSVFCRNKAKEKMYATSVPHIHETYIFKEQKEYFEDYQKSYFGLTQKKAGWDCLRHYEIISNYCMPLFYDLEKCPKQTMCLFPKEILLNYLNKHPEIRKLNHLSEDTIRKNNWPMVEIDDDYWETMEKIWQYSYDNLNTEKTVEYILEKLS